MNQNVQPGGQRLLGIAVTEAADGNYDAAFARAKAVGMQAVSLKVDWDDVEKEPGKYQSPWPEIANLYYPPQKVQVSLRVATLDTVKNRLPADLRNKPFDHPEVIERYNRLLDWLFDRMPAVRFSEISVGNEVDGFLGSQEKRWQEYRRFFQKTRAHIRRRHPRVPVGVSVMYAGHTGAASKQVQELNRHTDTVMVSYYPLNADFTVQPPESVHQHFDAIARLYPGRSVSFVEAGYPSGEKARSSPEKQKQFIEELFAAWDKHSRQIGSVHFVWLTDIARSSVEHFGQYYGSASPAFLDYLATLGLRTRRRRYR